MTSKDEKNYKVSSDGVEVKDLRDDFPIFQNSPHYYFDNASTTHKPKVVLEAMEDFYASNYANVHRGVYHLSAQASDTLEQARANIAQYIGAEAHEVIFTHGTTDAINTVARGLDRSFFSKGSNICVGASEHHANLIPWQETAKRFDIELRILPLDDQLRVDIDSAKKLITKATALVAVAHTSNVTGVRHPIEALLDIAHEQDALVLVDAAQGMLCEPDTGGLDVDFLTFSSHKIFGPMGVGILYAKHHLQERMQPLRFGGDMVDRVTYKDASWAPGPRKFEAGTLPVAEAIGLSASLGYITKWGASNLYQQACLVAAEARRLLLSGGWKVLGNEEPTSIISFYHKAIHPHDIASILANHNISIRGGHHCAQPFLRSQGLSATARVSFAAYNQLESLDVLGEALADAKRIFDL